MGKNQKMIAGARGLIVWLCLAAVLCSSVQGIRLIWPETSISNGSTEGPCGPDTIRNTSLVTNLVAGGTYNFTFDKYGAFILISSRTGPLMERSAFIGKQRERRTCRKHSILSGGTRSRDFCDL